MDWVHTLTTIGTLGGIFWWFISRQDISIARLDADVNATNTKIDGWIQHITTMQAEQSKRIDELYAEQSKRTDILYNELINITKALKK